jgi:hypothetical protein
VQDQHILSFGAVDDDVFANGKRPQSWPQVVIAAATFCGNWESRKNRSVIEVISRSAISKLPLFRLCTTRYRQARLLLRAIVCAPLPGRVRLFGGKLGASAPLHILGQRAHGILREDPAFATGKGCVSQVNLRQDLGAGPLAFFPQRQSLLDGVFLASVTARVYGLPDKGFLVVCEMYVHAASVKTGGRAVKSSRHVVRTDTSDYA